MDARRARQFVRVDTALGIGVEPGSVICPIATRRGGFVLTSPTAFYHYTPDNGTVRVAATLVRSA